LIDYFCCHDAHYAYYAFRYALPLMPPPPFLRHALPPFAIVTPIYAALLFFIDEA